jgi:hypothetical protein
VALRCKANSIFWNNFCSHLPNYETTQGLEREAQRLGPNIYDADASLVACSDQAELDRVAKTFMNRFEGIDADELDQAISRVCQLMSGTPRKYRAVFYFFLTLELGKMEE